MTNKLANPSIVIAPDSFKGSLTALQAAKAMERGVLRAMPSACIQLCPMADGGEGTLGALLSSGGSRHTISVRGAGSTAKDASIGILEDASGVIEIAEIIGFTDIVGIAAPACKRTTLGVGDAIKALLDRGCKRIHIGLGGSSTNDGGAGMLTALGVRLLDADGNTVAPTPDSLCRIARIDITNLDKRLHDCELSAMTDVDNPLTGARGATRVFGGQKGILADQIDHFDANLAHFAAQAEIIFSRSGQDMVGSGAAGGLGFSLRMLGADIRSGAQVISDVLHLDAALTGADWALTGEGRSDMQTLHGKAPYVVCEKARHHKVAVSLLSGSVDGEGLPALSKHFAGCFSVIPRPMTLQTSMQEAETLLTNAAQQVAGLWSASHRR